LADDAQALIINKMIVGLLRKLLSLLASAIGFVPSLVYTYVYSRYYTLPTYSYIAEEINRINPKTILDVGTATGEPLFSIINQISPSVEVIGIDIVNTYLESSRQLFRSHPNVSIQQMNFYALGTLRRKFGAIIFGSSFMLMPDKIKALQIAKENLAEGGSIFFLQTVYRSRNILSYAMEYIKPYLYYITTVDFGTVTYRDEFESLLNSQGLRMEQRQRTAGNTLLRVFNFEMIEATAL
jgi:ubiquinone/menaquinone biosynthesis C-methylase UbiE